MFEKKILSSLMIALGLCFLTSGAKAEPSITRNELMRASTRVLFQTPESQQQHRSSLGDLEVLGYFLTHEDASVEYAASEIVRTISELIEEPRATADLDLIYRANASLRILRELEGIASQELSMRTPKAIHRLYEELDQVKTRISSQKKVSTLLGRAVIGFSTMSALSWSCSLPDSIAGTLGVGAGIVGAGYAVYTTSTFPEIEKNISRYCELSAAIEKANARAQSLQARIRRLFIAKLGLAHIRLEDYANSLEQSIEEATARLLPQARCTSGVMDQQIADWE